MSWTPLRREPEAPEPRPVGASLRDVAKRLGLASPGVLGVVFRDWETVVGQPLARHARPVGLRGDVLLIDVDEPGWATQLRYLHDEIVARVNDAIGSASVRELSVRVRATGFGDRKSRRTSEP